MRHRLTIPLVIVALTMGVVAGCGGPPPPEGPTPEEIEAQEAQAAEEARRAEEERLRREREAEEQRRRAEMEARERAVRAETEAARGILEELIHFDFDRSNIRPDAERVMMRKLAVLRANPDVRLRIAGHCDERGSVEYNLALGQRRAEAAKDFLVGFGISANRIDTVSFGEDRPLVRASNEEAWAMNRRNEFTIIAGADELRNPGGP